MKQHQTLGTPHSPLRQKNPHYQTLPLPNQLSTTPKRLLQKKRTQHIDKFFSKESPRRKPYCLMVASHDKDTETVTNSLCINVGYVNLSMPSFTSKHIYDARLKTCTRRTKLVSQHVKKDGTHLSKTPHTTVESSTLITGPSERPSLMSLSIVSPCAPHK